VIGMVAGLKKFYRVDEGRSNAKCPTCKQIIPLAPIMRYQFLSRINGACVLVGTCCDNRFLWANQDEKFLLELDEI